MGLLLINLTVSCFLDHHIDVTVVLYYLLDIVIR
jgi:hypothetical protein